MTTLRTHRQPCACAACWRDQIEPVISPPQPQRGPGQALTEWWPSDMVPEP